MINETEKDILEGKFHCPRCGCVMTIKSPNKDKRLVRFKESTLRLKCSCGHYEDRLIVYDIKKN